MKVSQLLNASTELHFLLYTEFHKYPWMRLFWIPEEALITDKSSTNTRRIITNIKVLVRQLPDMSVSLNYIHCHNQSVNLFLVQ